MKLDFINSNHTIPRIINLYKERVAAGRDSASLPHCTILAQCSGFIVDSRFVLVVGITIDPFFSLRRWGGAAEALLNLAL